MVSETRVRPRIMSESPSPLDRSIEGPLNSPNAAAAMEAYGSGISFKKQKRSRMEEMGIVPAFLDYNPSPDLLKPPNWEILQRKDEIDTSF